MIEEILIYKNLGLVNNIDYPFIYYEEFKYRTFKTCHCEMSLLEAYRTLTECDKANLEYIVR